MVNKSYKQKNHYQLSHFKITSEKKFTRQNTRCPQNLSRMYISTQKNNSTLFVFRNQIKKPLSGGLIPSFSEKAIKRQNLRSSADKGKSFIGFLQNFLKPLPLVFTEYIRILFVPVACFVIANINKNYSEVFV